MRRTKDGLIPTLRLTILVDKPDPDGMTAFLAAVKSRLVPVTLSSPEGFVLGSGVVVAVVPEEDGR